MLVLEFAVAVAGLGKRVEEREEGRGFERSGRGKRGRRQRGVQLAGSSGTVHRAQNRFQYYV